MSNRVILAALLLSAGAAMAQATTNASNAALQAPATLPVTFTNTVSADSSHAGDVVLAKTEQEVRLANGTVIPSGTKVTGHVVLANGFAYDKTPYAHQKPSALSIHFDSVEVNGVSLPLSITVRAMADPITSRDARTPQASDMDPSATVTQIGGDQMSWTRSEVVNRDGDVVAYNRHGGVYAHLISSGHCDGSDVEVSVGLYSASACGLYGFTNVSATEFGSPAIPSTLTLVSTRTSPKVWKHSTALLEVLPATQTIASR